LKKKIGIVTSLRKDYAVSLLSKFSLDECIDVVVTPSECRTSKPSPASINLALRKLGSQPQSAVYVGNEIIDVIAAKRAKCYSAIASWGVNKPIGAEADYVLRSLDDVLRLV
jgi:pyrophosphatase PpaX